MRKPPLLLLTLICLLSIVATAPDLHATTPLADTLVLHGRKHLVHQVPLPSEVAQRLDPQSKESICSANWAGYLVHARVENGLLFIDSVTIKNCEEPVAVPMKKLFRRSGPHFAEWFSGELFEYLNHTAGYTYVTNLARVYRFKRGKFVGSTVRRVHP